MKLTIHLYDRSAIQYASEDIINDYYKLGWKGTRCGFVSKNTTIENELVTCKKCLLKLKS